MKTIKKSVNYAEIPNRNNFGKTILPGCPEVHGRDSQTTEPIITKDNPLTGRSTSVWT
jgi:hypothetical protein